MAVKSGFGGNAKLSAASLVEVTDVIRWTWNKSTEFKPYNSSDTAGNTKRLTGNTDSNGTIEFYQPGGLMGFARQPGILVAIELNTAGGVKTVSGNVAITEFASEVAVEDKDLIKATISWEQNGVMALI